MQLHMSSASMPSPGQGTIPPPITPGPAVVAEPPGRPRRRILVWLASLAAAVAVIGSAWFATRAPGEKAGGPGGPVSIGAATVFVGDLDRTVRISGTVAAERYATLLAPQLHGRRGSGGGGGGGGGSSSGGGGSSSVRTSSGSGSGNSGTSSSAVSSYTSSTASINIGSSSLSSSSGGGSDLSSGGSGGSRGGGNRFGDRAPRATTGGGRSGGGMTSGGGGSSGGSGGSMGGGMRGGGGGFSSGGGGFGLVLLKLAPPGTRVQKGDIVAEFDRESQLTRLDDIKANFVQAELNIKRLKADLEVARKAYEQRILVAKAQVEKARLDLKTVVVRSAIEAEHFNLNLEESEAQLRQLQSDLKLLEISHQAQLRAAEIDRDQSRIELGRAQANVDRMILRAPIDGLVVMQTVFRMGDFAQIQQGDQVYPGQPVVQIVDPDSMVVNATVNQVDAESVRLGMKAAVRIDAYPDVQVPARVIGIAAMTRNMGQGRTTWAREIPVRLKLEAIDPRIIPDLTGSADILLSTERQATLAPLGSIFTDGGRPFVFLRAPNGWVRRDVELGPASYTHAVIRAGLDPGSVIAAQAPAGRN